jgi:HAE1 family hydrophobic/amphiphilic exporter-1
MLRIDSAYSDVEQIRNYPLKPGVFVSDIADVRLARSYRDTVSRVNGKRSLTLTISKESDRNTVEVCSAVKRQLEEMGSDERLKGFEFTVYFDQSTMIVGALDNLKSSLLFGAVFSVLVLYAFVRRLSITALVALAIPVSLLAAVIGLFFAGFTFNIVSLAGITLATGMLVDNSIVVAENVLRLRAEGRNPLQAAASGASQVALAIVLSTLTTVVVFAPMVFMAEGKSTRALLAELGAPICFSLIASLFVALFLLPITMVLVARFERGKAATFERSNSRCGTASRRRWSSWRSSAWGSSPPRISRSSSATSRREAVACASASIYPIASRSRKRRTPSRGWRSSSWSAASATRCAT